MCRYGKTYEAVYLEGVPHRRLTKPARVFEYVFEGSRPARGRENIVKLEVQPPGSCVPEIPHRVVDEGAEKPVAGAALLLCIKAQ